MVVLLLAAAACGDDGGQVVDAVGDTTTTARDGLALPHCDDVPDADGATAVADLSADPEVAEWQQRRADVGMPSDEAATRAAADAPATEPEPASAFGFPMTQAEATAWFDFQEAGDAVIGDVRALVGDEPWFTLVFLDNATRVIGVAIEDSADPADVQALLDDELGAGTTRVVVAPNTEDELAAAHEAAATHLDDLGIRYAGIGSGNIQGIVRVDLEVLDSEVVAGLAAAVPAGTVCVTGANPADVVPEGPQPEAGDGWRLLADEPGIGMAYATGAATDQAGYGALWAEIGLPGDPPAVDFATEVVLWFGPAVSGSCDEIRLDDVVLDEETAIMRPEIVLVGGNRSCTDDANPHAYVVAYERSRLPQQFTVTVAPNDQCCPEATTEVEL
jgi:hypothetical protein